MIGIELEKAISLIEENINEIIESQEIELINGNRRVLMEDIYAPINNPPFNRSPLDGYALRSKDTKGANKNNSIKLKVIDEVFAGSYSNKVLNKGEAIRIMTGAKIPEGADCIIRQENTNEGMDIVEIYEELSKYDNYCCMGEDINKGTLLMKKGEVLSYVHIGVLSSMGFNKVKVKRLPRVALFATGDEVCKPGEALKEGKIYDSNLHLIYSRLFEFGIVPKIYEIIGDSYEELSKRIEEVIEDVDIVITTGGVSVGKKDILHEALPLINAKRIFWKVKLKPGTPAMFSLYKNKPILSLSGNPFAATTTFELLGRPALAKLSGNSNINIKRVKAIMESDFNKASNVRRFIRGSYENGKVKLLNNKHSSGMLWSMIGCNALIDIKAGSKKLSVNEEVNIILL